MKLFHSEKYTIPLPEKHRFPMDKYRLLRSRLINENVFPTSDIFEAKLATKEEILLVHTSISLIQFSDPLRKVNQSSAPRTMGFQLTLIQKDR